MLNHQSVVEFYWNSGIALINGSIHVTIPPFVVFEREKLDGEVVQDKCHPYSYKCVINVGGINNNNLESSVKSDIIESSFSSIYTKSDSYKSIKLWIHNKLPSSYYGKPLCLSYQKEGQSALLKECRLDEGQKWIISDSHAGRIVSFSATEDEIKTMKCDSTQTLF
ncbi:hypothetical protein H8356DRAFT_1279658 [Neocallimastix lanati (nom. inval.)]|uniref:Uncharacterized protein n=1 Tax=Neocallimastix californiae TaxID=1754190 RepID=A0A1Y2DCW2_9FUNG|nr:hypothetical protein H8356DRAFT_1279658 [Neocallimastix sp. JGI-2020a]ORY56525.1 hypothetical protein LY90DRAFT_506781 [Neocallimastix californiae]|eukprot:ORY56525.1 hypothetical protein LY90DRAFT_506781 [Neocallimastix californiae]